MLRTILTTTFIAISPAFAGPKVEAARAALAKARDEEKADRNKDKLAKLQARLDKLIAQKKDLEAGK